MTATTRSAAKAAELRERGAAPVIVDGLDAKPPLRMPAWLGRLAVGEVGVLGMTEGRGASNAKAKRELGLQLEWPSWREGFRHALAK